MQRTPQSPIRPSVLIGAFVAFLAAYWWFDGKGGAFPDAASNAFTSWVVLISALSAILVVLLVPLLSWWRQALNESFTKRWLHTPVTKARWKEAGMLLATFLLFLTLGLPDLIGVTVMDHEYVAPLRTSLYVWIILAALVSFPAALGMLALQRGADLADWSTSSAANSDSAELFSARGRLRTFLSALGAIVALSVVTTGALQRAVVAGDPETTFTSESVLIYGALLTGLLLALYLPAHLSIERRASRLRDRLNPPNGKADSVAWLKQRKELSDVLEIKGVSTQSLQEAVLILAPLIAGIVSTFLTPK